jgi:hypothetical protein
MTKANGKEENGVASLQRVRASLVSQIGEKEAELQILVQQLAHLDATLNLMRPGIELEELPERPAILGPRVKRGEHTRPVLTALHQAKGPMTIREIARAVLLAQGKPALRISGDACNNVRGALRKLKPKGAVRVVGTDGQTQTWELVREP